MLHTVGQNSQDQGLDSDKGLLTRWFVHHHAGSLRHFANPASIGFLFNLDGQIHSLHTLSQTMPECKRGSRHETICMHSRTKSRLDSRRKEVQTMRIIYQGVFYETAN